MHVTDMSADTIPHPSTGRLLRLFAWLRWRSLSARFKKSRRESPLLIFILAGFVICYLVFGFLLFRSGLSYIYRFPLVGSLLAERILYLIFGFFFIMLVVSNLIIGYSTLFRNREAEWFLSLPMRHRDVYRWKFIEAIGISSWALVFLSAPMLAAYGVIHDVPWNFYVQVALGYLPFVVIPAVAGSWLVLLIVRALSKPWAKAILVGGAALLLAYIFFGVKPVTEAEAAKAGEVLMFPKLMQGSRAATSVLLPSAWLAMAIRDWSIEGMGASGLFFFLLLLSYALFGLLLAFSLAGRSYYGSWSASLGSQAERQQRASEAKRRRGRRMTFLGWMQAKLRPLSPRMTALVFKDIRVFWRDPVQWTQFMIFFGLLCIYVANLRNVAVEFHSGYWETLISYLNLAACALTLSTLTTRFIFPMFSLEGRRVWILGLSPVGLRGVVLEKFWASFLTSTILTVALMATSAAMLHLGWARGIFFATTTLLMSAALSGLAAGLGAIFPDFREDNPSKIVSSFGGTLCLVISFVYNTAVVTMLATPDMLAVTDHPAPVLRWLLPLLAGVLSLAVAVIPMTIALRRVKSLEI
jgi:ABC-2 type transport system permease protein